MKMKSLSVKELNSLKIEARKAGYVASENYMKEFTDFFNNKELAYVEETGHVMEIIMLWILGMLQAELHEVGIYFFVKVSPALDRHQVDYAINNALIQQKYGWSDVDIDSMQDVLRFRNIHVINIKKYGDDMNYDIIDSLVEMLRLAGLNQQEIDDAVNNDSAFDAAYEIWTWYTRKS